MTALPPRPVADIDTQPHWDGVAERRLLVPRCRSCARWIWQPKPICPSCHAIDPEWVERSGDASIVSWTVLYPPVLEVWADKLPIVVLLVELDDAPGVRIVGNLVSDDGELLRSDGSELSMGAPVALRWRVDEAGQTFPAYSLR